MCHIMRHNEPYVTMLCIMATQYHLYYDQSLYLYSMIQNLYCCSHHWYCCHDHLNQGDLHDHHNQLHSV